MKTQKKITRCIKKLRFKAGEVKPSNIGALLSGLIKTDMGKLIKSINEHPNCIQYANFNVCLFIYIDENNLTFDVTLPSTIDLIRSKADNNVITKLDIEEIAELKKPYFNTNLKESCIKIVMSTLSQTNITLKEHV